MTADEQEAKSRFHTGFWIVPLSSGKLGVAAHPLKSLLGVVETVTEAATLVQKHYEETKPVMVLPRGINEPLLELNLDGIDL